MKRGILTFIAHCIALIVHDGLMRNVESLKLNHNKHFQFKVSPIFRTIVLSTGLCIIPVCSNAITGLEAGELFQKSNDANILTEKNYQSTETKWNSMKKKMNENINQIKEVNRIVIDSTDEFNKIENRLTKLFTDGKAFQEKIELEIQSLLLSTAQKYEVAEAASANLAKPSVIAKLFLVAQNDANLLTEDYLISKFLMNINNGYEKLNVRVKGVINALDNISKMIEDAEKVEESSLVDMDQGLLISSQSCRDKLNECAEKGKVGVEFFKKSAGLTNAAQDKYLKSFKSLESDVRTIQNLANEFNKETDQLLKEREAQNIWEKQYKLGLKTGKQIVNTYLSEVKLITDEINSQANKLEKKYNERIENEKIKMNEKNYVALSGQLKVVIDSLETAQKSGVMTERLFQQAQQRGDKESAQYLKMIAQSQVKVSPTAMSSPSSIKMTPSYYGDRQEAATSLKGKSNNIYIPSSIASKESSSIK